MCIVSMALREVKPLNKEQWKQVTDALDAGPTAEQKEYMIEARKIAKQMREGKE